MKNAAIIFQIAAVFSFFSCAAGNYPPLEVVERVDLDRYLGKWYEIARLPNSFEEGCECITAEYSKIDDETIRVINSCLEDGEFDSAKGKAFPVEGSNNAKLKVQFFWPFKGDYWIIDLDKENYSYALVGNPSRKYLWILSRTPKISDELLQKIVDVADKKKFDTTKLIYTDQSCFEE